jgi:amino acid transporter
VLGLVLAMFTFVTFEGVITFSEEATVPKRTVATAMYGAVIITGGIMVVASYIMTVGFRHAGSDVAQSANPLSDLADIAGVHWLSYVLQLGIVIGMFAGGLALTNWLSRLLYTLGREGVLPRSLGEAHPEHQTPWKATRVIVALELLVFAVLALLGKASDLTLYSYIGSYFTLLYIFVYGVALVAVAYVAWRHWGAKRTALLAVIPTAVLVLVVYNSVHPEPPSPLNYYTYASLLTMVVIAVIAWVGSRRKQGRLARLGSTSVDLL